MTPSDIPKTAIITPFGLYEFTRMPFGLRNAAQAFQRMMDSTCKELPFVFAYIDDLLVASSNEQEHLTHLEALFNRLKDNGLVINPSKCKFGSSQIEFLGHEITAMVLHLYPVKCRPFLILPNHPPSKAYKSLFVCSIFITDSCLMLPTFYFPFTKQLAKSPNLSKPWCGPLP